MYKVAQLTDCHLFADRNKTSYSNINPFDSLKEVLKHVNQHCPHLVLVTGDISGDHSLQSYQHFLDLWNASACEAQLAVIPGNHDDPQVMEDLFGQRVLSENPAISCPGWQIHGLNSHYRGTLGRVSAHGLEQLALVVQYAPDLNHLVAVHHHSIATGGWMDKHEWLNAGEFNELVKQYPQIKMVINGHVHMETDDRVNECRFMSCPSTCWQFANTNEFAVSELKPGFRIIELGKDGQLDSHTLRI